MIAAAAAALRAGKPSTAAGTRRQPKATSHAARPETSVTCNPEMLMRCVTPVRLKSRHSSAEIARWSPTASAAGLRFDLELEAHRARPDGRQARDHAHHIEIAALELRREPVRHAQVR